MFTNILLKRLQLKISTSDTHLTHLLTNFMNIVALDLFCMMYKFQAKAHEFKTLYGVNIEQECSFTCRSHKQFINIVTPEWFCKV